jgi:hypothetical protein
MTAPRHTQFAVRRRSVRPSVEIAFIHEGRSGIPLLLLHGWPGSKRLFWKNIEPLAAAGFEVIVPDLPPVSPWIITRVLRLNTMAPAPTQARRA